MSLPPGPARCRSRGVPRRPRRLGARAGRARATRSRWPTRRCSTSSGRRYPHTQLTRVRPRASACPTGRWATPRSATSTSAPARSSRRTSTRIDDAVADGSFVENEVAARGAAPARERRAPASGSCPTAACTRGCEHLRALHRAGARELGVPDLVLHAFTDGRDTLPDVGAGLPRDGRGLVRARRAPAASAASSAATSRWTATSAGTASSRPTTCSCTGAASTRADTRRGGRARRLRARRDRRVHHADARRRGGAHPRPATA